MAESPDLDTLAKRYLDLWQDQVAAMAADPELSETMMRLWQNAAAAGPAGWAQLWGAAAAAQAQGGATAGSFRDVAASAAPAGPAPAAAAPRDRGDDVAELGRRIAELELRLGRIEAALAMGSGGERRGARARRRVQRPPAEGG